MALFKRCLLDSRLGRLAIGLNKERIAGPLVWQGSEWTRPAGVEATDTFKPFILQSIPAARQNTNSLLRWCHTLISKDGEQEIYNGILSTQIKLVKTFSLMTSLIGLGFQPILYSYSSHGGHTAVVLATGAFLSFFTFATPLLIHSVSKKYVTKLYYNQVEDKYTAVVYSILLKPKKIEFKLNDVKVPDIPGMFTTFKARNVPLFVEGSQFVEPYHYGKIMGFDKPIDMRWDHDLNMTEAEARLHRKK